MYKLFITKPVRYSEDIDLVQVEAEPIGEVLDRLKISLSFLGTPRIVRNFGSVKLIYRFDAEEPRGTTLRLKIEINSREHFSVLGYHKHAFSIANQWFCGKCDITTYQYAELIGTKIRALYQRRKGRDLFDLYIALNSGLLNPEVSVMCYKHYMASNDKHVPTAVEYAANLDDKMENSDFRNEILPYLAPDIDYDINEAHKVVGKQIVAIM